MAAALYSAGMSTPEKTSDGRVVLVVGGSGGLGEACARRFVAAGDTVVITYGRNAARAQELVEELGVRAVQLDLFSAESCARAIDSVAKDLGRIDVLVHAAGPHVPQKYLGQISVEEFCRQADADVMGTFRVLSPALPHLRESRGNAVVITSAGTQRYPARDGLSVIMKGAVEQLVSGLATEEGRFGVRFNAVGPGMTTAGMAQRLIADGDLHDEALQASMRNIPMKSFGDGDDIAAAVEFLASDAADYISGQKINVDGGYTA